MNGRPPHETDDGTSPAGGSVLPDDAGGPAAIALEREVARLHREIEAAASTVRRLSDERDALNWQLELERNYLSTIKNSRTWIAARFLYYLHGLLVFDRAVILEAKNSLDDILSRRTGADTNPIIRRGALFARTLLDGTFEALSRKSSGHSGGEGDRSRAERRPYGSAYQEDESFPVSHATVKAVAFYLPQFHTFPENDAWWGKGFTEWSNTRKAKPRFPGHYQPRVPHRDIGYYDLADVETLRRQVRLAKEHGIGAFCIYYYWFNGKRLMERPVESLLAHPEIDFPFCLCWANENWTRTWDGQEKSVLIRQEYSEENDLRLIEDLKRFFEDPRYLRCNGRPVILVYHAKIMPDPDRTFSTWRRYCRENGIGEIQIWACRTFLADNEFEKPAQVDREIEFPPHRVASLEMFPPEKFHAYEKDGYYYDYEKVVEDVVNRKTMADRSPYPIYRCAMMGWDNSCRRDSGYSIWQYYSLASYHRWLREAIEYTERNFIPSERFLFLNAWNEWGEGTYLEPDEKYGYANINTTSRALCDLPAKSEYELLPRFDGALPSPGKVLVHLHCFYPDLLPEFLGYFERIPFDYDLVVTTDEKRKEERIGAMLRDHPLSRCRDVTTVVCVNRGRDVAPFLESCAERIGNYDFVGHFHTKKSLSVTWGDEWRRYLLDNLLGSAGAIKAIFRRFQRDGGLGLYYPVTVPMMSHYVDWEGNCPRCEEILHGLGMEVALPAQPHFPAGQMFWARTKAVKGLFGNPSLSVASFEEEADQLSGTLAHAVERIWTYVAEGNGYSSLAAVLQPEPSPVPWPGKRRLALYAHYSADGVVSDCDRYFLRCLQAGAEVVVIANGGLCAQSRLVLEEKGIRVIQRPNKGYDFAAWREALATSDLGAYDELVLANNSVLGPFVPFGKIFARMEGSPADFWGMTEFPETRDPRRAESKWLPGGVIPSHLQSYFLVFRRKAFLSEPFKEFWRRVADATTLTEAVGMYEARLTAFLEAGGLRGDVYLKASGRLQERGAASPDYNALYCRPMDFIVLGFPFLKKNIRRYLDQPQINETIRLVEGFTGYPCRIRIASTRGGAGNGR